MNGSRPTTRIAVLLGSSPWTAWQVSALRTLVSEPGVEIAFALIAADSEGRPPPGAMADARRAEIPTDPLQAMSPVVELGDAAIRIVEELADGTLRDARIDLIWSSVVSEEAIRLGRQVPGGTWTIEVEGGDSTLTRALVEGRRTVSARLIRLGLDDQHARVLDEGRFMVEPFSPAFTRARVLHGAAVWPARRLRAWRLQGDVALDGPSAPIVSDPPRPALAAARTRLRQIGGLATRAWESCFSEKWTIGICERPIHTFLEDPVPRARWLPEMDGRDYYADPFGAEVEGGTVILAEAFRAKAGVGRIDVLEMSSGDPQPSHGDILRSQGHRSYPFLLPHEGEWYCVPESYQERRVDLYRGDPFPERWSRVTTLVSDFPGIDPTVFRHEDHWWLLCGNHDDEGNTKLYGFFSDALVGPWFPHPLNPLKCDVRSSRPAGTPFRTPDGLYRPAQDCSATYGGAIVINRIERLSPIEFRESPAVRIAPDSEGPYSRGMHTLSSMGARTLIDGKRSVFDPSALLEAGGHFIRRLRRYREGR